MILEIRVGSQGLIIWLLINPRTTQKDIFMIHTKWYKILSLLNIQYLQVSLLYSKKHRKQRNLRLTLNFSIWCIKTCYMAYKTDLGWETSHGTDDSSTGPKCKISTETRSLQLIPADMVCFASVVLLSKKACIYHSYICIYIYIYTHIYDWERSFYSLFIIC